MYRQPVKGDSLQLPVSRRPQGRQLGMSDWGECTVSQLRETVYNSQSAGGHREFSEQYLGWVSVQLAGKGRQSTITSLEGATRRSVGVVWLG